MIWRISDRRAFSDLARSGRKGRSRTLWCSYVDDLTAAPLRVGYAVGRSIGPATTRNRLRRRLRSIVATAAPAIGVAHGWLLIGAKPGADERTFPELRADVVAVLKQVAPTPAESPT